MKEIIPSKQNGEMTVQKPITYALLLAATLAMAACEKTPEQKMDSAKESAAESVEKANDAAEKTGEAIEQKAEETHDEATK